MDTADAHNQKFASATGAVSETAHDIGGLLRLVQSNQEFWEPRWMTSRMLAKPSLVVKGRAPGRILKRVWRGDGGAPHAQTTLLTSATLATPGFGEASGWQSIATAVGISGANSDLIHVDLCAVVHPEAFGTLRARFADPCAPIPSPGADGTLSPEFISRKPDCRSAFRWRALPCLSAGIFRRRTISSSSCVSGGAAAPAGVAIETVPRCLPGHGKCMFGHPCGMGRP